MSPAQVRAWWSHRQGLDGSLAGAAPEVVLERTGWARSVGGAGPYLTLWARAELSRASADAAATRLAIHELPAARGCTHVVPACDFALALKAGQPFDADFKRAAKLGVTREEIDKLCEAVEAAVWCEPLDPAAIREAVGGAARSLGADGVKQGMSTTLPLALGQLQKQGRIRRVAVNGRFDQQRFLYVAWRPNPLASCPIPQDEAPVELAQRYFRWIGPATMTEFQWFSGLGVKAARQAVAPLGLVEVGGGRLMLAGDVEAFREFPVPKEPQYSLTSSIDAMVLLRRDHASLVDGDAPAGLGGVTDLESNPVFDRGRLIGLWEYDAEAGEIVAAMFVKRNRELDQAIARMASFVRQELGDARSFSNDTPRSRQGRLAALRKLG